MSAKNKHRIEVVLEVLATVLSLGLTLLPYFRKRRGK